MDEPGGRWCRSHKADAVPARPGAFPIRRNPPPHRRALQEVRLVTPGFGSAVINSDISARQKKREPLRPQRSQRKTSRRAAGFRPMRDTPCCPALDPSRSSRSLWFKNGSRFMSSCTIEEKDGLAQVPPLPKIRSIVNRHAQPDTLDSH